MTVMPGVEIDPVVLEDFEVSLPCDYHEEDGCQDVARWILYGAGCCPAGACHALACDHCKEVRMTTEDGVECVGCGLITAPARHAYRRVEAI